MFTGELWAIFRYTHANAMHAARRIRFAQGRYTDSQLSALVSLAVNADLRRFEAQAAA